MNREISEKQRTKAMWVSPGDDRGEGYVSDGIGEIVAYVILLAMLVVLSTRGWVFDLWFR